jgi:predicted transcriptional regulator
MMNSKLDAKYSPTPLHYLMFILQQQSDDLLQGEVGLSLSHVRIMGVLDYSVPCSQKSIATQLQQTEANVSRQLLTMVRQGFVKVSKNKAEKALKAQLSSVYKGVSRDQKRDFEDVVHKIIGSL